MSSLSISPSNLLVISSAAGKGMDIDIKKAISPKNILEHIINFFTLGGVTRENKKNYLYILELMTNALALKEKPICIDASLYLDNINGCQVSFTPSEIDHNSTIVEVKKGNYSERCNINSNIFIDVCTALDMRKELGIPPDPLILTDSGKINMRGVNLGLMDLSKKVFRNVDFNGAYLFRTILNGADLTGSSFSDANLTRSEFEKAILDETVFSRAEAFNSRFSGAQLTNSDISHANFSCAEFSGADLSGTDASFSNFDSAIFRKADFSRVDLSGANLNKAIVEPGFLNYVSKFQGVKENKVIYTNTPRAKIAEIMAEISSVRPLNESHFYNSDGPLFVNGPDA